MRDSIIKMLLDRKKRRTLETRRRKNNSGESERNPDALHRDPSVK
jgi:hypothetical protein